MEAYIVVILSISSISIFSSPLTEVFEYGGFLLTLVGTFVTLWQARSARNAAQLARSYRDEVVADRLKSALGELLLDVKSAREKARSLLRQNPPRAERGMNSQKIINTIRDCLDSAREAVAKFTELDIRDQITAVEAELRNYVAVSDKEKPTVAYKIYDGINDLVASIAKLNHEKN